MKVFETYPEADCILYDDKKCDGDEGIKAMKNGEVAVNFEETYNFTVESISIKKGHKLTIYEGNINETYKHRILKERNHPLQKNNFDLF